MARCSAANEGALTTHSKHWFTNASISGDLMRISLRAKVLSAVVLLSTTASTALCQSQQSRLNPEKEQVIRQILEVTKAAEVMLVAMEAGLPAQRASNPSIPAVFWDRFAARAREQRRVLIDSLVPIYDRLFTSDELRELLRFYKTPFGQRFIAVSPDLARESIAAGQRWGAAIGQEVGTELQREGVKRP
jgi:uncharacterized protein